MVAIMRSIEVKILIMFYIILFSSHNLCQNLEILKADFNHNLKSKTSEKSIIKDDTSNTETKLKKVAFNIGSQIGLHSPDLTKNSSDFNRDIFFEIYIGYDLSDEVHAIIGFNYWEAQTNEVNMPEMFVPSETIIGKALKLELDFSLFKIYNVSILLGPSLSIENNNRAVNTVFSVGANAKLKLPILMDKVNLLSTIGYQTGGEFNFGGGYGYSFFNYLLGVEINFGNQSR